MLSHRAGLLFGSLLLGSLLTFVNMLLLMRDRSIDKLSFIIFSIEFVVAVLCSWFCCIERLLGVRLRTFFLGCAVLFVVACLNLMLLLARIDDISPPLFLVISTEVAVCVNCCCWCCKQCSERVGQRHIGCILAGHLLGAVVVLLLDIKVLSDHSAWCCKTPQDAEDLCQQMNLIGDLFEKWQVVHWLCHGTLLGAARSGASISWEADDDICVLTNLDEVKERLQNHGILVIPASGKSVPYRIVASSLSLQGYAEMWTDLYQYKRFNLTDGNADEALLSFPDTHINYGDGRNGTPTTRAGAEIVHMNPRLGSLFTWEAFPLTRINYCNRMWLVPRSFEKELASKYGSSWQTPRLPEPGVWNNGVRSWTCYLWMDGCIVFEKYPEFRLLGKQITGFPWMSR